MASDGRPEGSEYDRAQEGSMKRLRREKAMRCAEDLRGAVLDLAKAKKSIDDLERRVVELEDEMDRYLK